MTTQQQMIQQLQLQAQRNPAMRQQYESVIRRIQQSPQYQAQQLSQQRVTGYQERHQTTLKPIQPKQTVQQVMLSRLSPRAQQVIQRVQQARQQAIQQRKEPQTVQKLPVTPLTRLSPIQQMIQRAQQTTKFTSQKGTTPTVPRVEPPSPSKPVGALPLSPLEKTLMSKGGTQAALAQKLYEKRTGVKPEVPTPQQPTNVRIPVPQPQGGITPLKQVSGPTTPLPVTKPPVAEPVHYVPPDFVGPLAPGQIPWSASPEFKTFLNSTEGQKQLLDTANAMGKSYYGGVLKNYMSGNTKLLNPKDKEVLDKAVSSLVSKQYEKKLDTDAQQTRDKYNKVITNLQKIEKKTISPLLKKTFDKIITKIEQNRDKVTSEPKSFTKSEAIQEIYGNAYSSYEETQKAFSKDMTSIQNMTPDPTTKYTLPNYKLDPTTNTYKVEGTIDVAGTDVDSFNAWKASALDYDQRQISDIDVSKNALLQQINTASTNWHPKLQLTRTVRGEYYFDIPEGYSLEEAQDYNRYLQAFESNKVGGMIASFLSPENALGLKASYYRIIGDEQKAKDAEVQSFMGWDRINKQLGFRPSVNIMNPLMPVSFTPIPKSELPEGFKPDIAGAAGTFAQRWFESPATQIGVALVGGYGLGQAEVAATKLGLGTAFKYGSLGVGSTMMAPQAIGMVQSAQKGDWGNVIPQLGMLGVSALAMGGGMKLGKTSMSSAIETGTTGKFLTKAIIKSKYVADVRDLTTKVQSRVGIPKEVVTESGQLVKKPTFLVPRTEGLSSSKIAALNKFLDSAEANKYNIRFGSQKDIPMIKPSETGGLRPLQKGTLSAKGVLTSKPMVLEQMTSLLKTSFKKAGLTQDMIDSLLGKVEKKVTISETTRPDWYSPTLSKEQVSALTKYSSGDRSPDVMSIVGELTQKEIIGPKQTTITKFSSKEINALRQYFYGKEEPSASVIRTVKDLYSKGKITDKDIVITEGKRISPSSILKTKIEQAGPIREYLSRKVYGAERMQDIPLKKSTTSLYQKDITSPTLVESGLKRTSGAIYEGKGGKYYYTTNEGEIFSALPHKTVEGGIEFSISEGGKPFLDIAKRTEIMRDISSGKLRKVQVLKSHTVKQMEFAKEGTFEPFSRESLSVKRQEIGPEGARTRGYDVLQQEGTTKVSAYDFTGKEVGRPPEISLKDLTLPKEKPITTKNLYEYIRSSVKEKEFGTKIDASNRASKFNSLLRDFKQDVTEFTKTSEGSKAFKDYIGGKSTLKEFNDKFSNYLKVPKPKMEPIRTVARRAEGGLRELIKSEEGTARLPGTKRFITKGMTAEERLAFEYKEPKARLTPEEAEMESLARSMEKKSFLQRLRPLGEEGTQPVPGARLLSRLEGPQLERPIERTIQRTRTGEEFAPQISVLSPKSKFAMGPFATGTLGLGFRPIFAPYTPLKQPQQYQSPIVSPITSPIQVPIQYPVSETTQFQGTIPIQQQIQTPIVTPITEQITEPTTEPIPPYEEYPYTKKSSTPFGGLGFPGGPTEGKIGGARTPRYGQRGYKEREWEVPDIWEAAKRGIARQQPRPKKPQYAKLIK